VRTFYFQSVSVVLVFDISV